MRAITVLFAPVANATKYRFNVNGVQQDVPAANVLPFPGGRVGLNSVTHLGTPVSGNYIATVTPLFTDGTPVASGMACANSTAMVAPNSLAVLDEAVQQIDGGGMVL